MKKLLLAFLILSLTAQSVLAHCGSGRRGQSVNNQPNTEAQK